MPLAWPAFAALAVLAVVAIAHFGRGWSFFYDEWGVILYRRSGGLPAFFAPLNGHLVAIPVGVYRLLFVTFGLSSYTPYRWVTIVAHLGLMTLVFAYVRRRLPASVALLAVAPVLVLGYAWEVLFWMMNLGFVIPLICLLGIMMLSDRWTESRLALPVQALVLAVALASSGLGVAVAAGAMFEKALRRRWRDLAWLFVPVAGYALWFFLYRSGASTPSALRRLPGASPRGDVGSLGFSLGNVQHIPAYLLKLAESASSGWLGSSGRWYWLVIVVGLIVAGVLLGMRITPRFVSIAVVLGVFWLLTSLVRAQVGQPTSSRYIYPGAVLIVLLVAEAWSGLAWRRVAGRRRNWIVLAALFCGVAVAVVSGVGRLETVGNGATRLFARTRVELARLSCSTTHLPPTYAPDPTFIPYVRLDLYRAAVRDLGSPVPAVEIRNVCGGHG